jgi:hypothetical protein
MWVQLPISVVHRILDYDGRIKYRRGVYMDRLDRADPRLEIVEGILKKRLVVLQSIEMGSRSFYFETEFEGLEYVGLAYYYSEMEGHLEICFFDFRELDDIVQIKTVY